MKMSKRKTLSPIFLEERKLCQKEYDHSSQERKKTITSR